jgi:hypothetical protein
LFTVAAKRHGVWERGFVDVKQTMEDMVTKLSDRLDAMNTEFKDSFREVGFARDLDAEHSGGHDEKGRLPHGADITFRARRQGQRHPSLPTPYSTTSSEYPFICDMQASKGGGCGGSWWRGTTRFGSKDGFSQV